MTAGVFCCSARDRLHRSVAAVPKLHVRKQWSHLSVARYLSVFTTHMPRSARGKNKRACKPTIQTYINTYIHTYIHTLHTYIHTYMHIYPYIHPSIHACIHTCIQHNLSIHNLLVHTLPHTTCSTPILHHLFSLSCFPHAIFTFLLLLVGRSWHVGLSGPFIFPTLLLFHWLHVRSSLLSMPVSSPLLVGMSPFSISEYFGIFWQS